MHHECASVPITKQYHKEEGKGEKGKKVDIAAAPTSSARSCYTKNQASTLLILLFQRRNVAVDFVPSYEVKTVKTSIFSYFNTKSVENLRYLTVFFLFI
ncbi:unnamed protein product [Mucor hiemalis]